MTILAVLALSCGGFTALALSMTKHHRDLFGRPPSKARKLALAAGGWSLLAASAAPAVIGQGASIGLVLWFGLATVAALAMAMGLTYGSRVRRASPRQERTAPLATEGPFP